MTDHTILQVNSSSRYTDSVTRQVAKLIINNLTTAQTTLINRDLAKGLPFIDEQWVGANFTAEEDRTELHQSILNNSDNLVAELQQANHIVIAAPIYNFSIPAVLKAWIDLITRARLTFKYTENGVEGLLNNKKAYLVMASGGVPIGSAMDFASPYLKHILAFIGITEVVIVDANKVDLTTKNATADVEKQLASEYNH